MKGNPMIATQHTTETDRHPAIIAHVKGHSLTYAILSDCTVYLVSLQSGEYLVSEWSDGKYGVQKV